MAQHWSAATTTNSQITILLAALGTLWVSYQLYQFASFVHFNFLRSSKLASYQKRSPDGKLTSWALITGSSDGIGKGFAQELCRRGFNVILHGRNEQKLKAVKAELEQQWPHSHLKIIVFDAGTGFGKDRAGLEPVIASISDLNITVLINNIGGGPSPSSLPLGESSTDRVREMIDANATITTEITRLLIPILAKRSPALIMTVGSFAGVIGVPYVSLYSGVKAYGEAMSKALHVEMKLENHGIEVIHLQLGKVQSGREADTKVSFMVPSSRQLAATSLDKVGCGRSVIIPYWPHAMELYMMMAMPASVMEMMLMGIVKDEMKNKKAAQKQQ